MMGKIKDMVEGLLGAVIGIAILIAIVALAGLFIKGAVWFSVKVIPWITMVSGAALIITIFGLLPMATIRKTRIIACVGMLIATYIFSLHLWIYSLLSVYGLWGITGVVIGLFLMGIGVVPIAGLAFLFNGLWGELISFVVSVLIVIGTGAMAGYLATKIEQRGEEQKYGVLYPEISEDD